MPDKLNRTTRCTMCADNRRALKLTPIHQTGSRVDLGDALICPTHDLGGPVQAYPRRVAAAAGYEVDE